MLQKLKHKPLAALLVVSCSSLNHANPARLYCYLSL